MATAQHYQQAIDVHIDQVSSLLLTVPPGQWNGLYLRLFHNFAYQEVQVPAINEHLLAIQRGSTEVAGKVQRRFSRRRLPSGNLIILPRGEPSEWDWTTAIYYTHLYLEPQFLEQAAAETLNMHPAHVDLALQLAADDQLIVQIGLALEHEARTPGVASRLYVDALIQALAMHLLRQHAVVRRAPGAQGRLAPETLRRITRHIAEHLAEELTLEQLAGIAKISQFHLARMFRQSTGLSLHRYVTQQRLGEAKRLLLEGRHPIAEVAQLTGFADQSHLHRRFKAAYGITPGALLGERTNLQRASKNIQDSGETIE